jgi:hypothetical protein
MTKIFYDFEATSLSRDCDPISVGLVAVTNNVIKTFYAEFNDYNTKKCDKWVIDNIVSKMVFSNCSVYYSFNENTIQKYDHINLKADKESVKTVINKWLSQFNNVEFYADNDLIDRPLLVDLIADWDYNIENVWLEDNQEVQVHKVGIPLYQPNINYDKFFDLNTLFSCKAIDTDINREVFAIGHSNNYPEWLNATNKHNSLFDAYIAFMCYEKLIRL